jgi:predicted thioesterase
MRRNTLRYCALRPYCAEANRFHARKKAKTNNVVATKALAHKLARASYHILKEGKPFDAGYANAST